MIMVIYHNLTKSQAMLVSGIMAAFVMTVDLVRHQVPAFQKFMMKSFRRVMRENEINGISGTTFLMVGVFTVVSLFPRDVAVLAIGMLAFGDPISSIIGVRFGKDKIIGNKSLQGTMAGFATCTLLSFFYYLSKDLMVDRLVLVSLISGMLGAVSEIIPVGKLDDNLTFPVIAAFMLSAIFALFGGY
ncbi:MAG: diacylglycerol/polyprenol kinase family protein [Bdellovibrionales bacterium]